MLGVGKLLTGAQKVGGLILPILGKPGDFRSLSPGARLALRLAVLGLVLVLLGGISYALGLDRLIQAPAFLGPARYAWLPLLFLLAYVFAWLALWLWGQLGAEQVDMAFPDIDQAWSDAVGALDRAGISLNELPIFLVLGRPEGPEAALFDGAELLLKVRGVPARDDAPIRIYANREAIYVTCASASVLGRQAAILGTSEFEAPVPTQSVLLNQSGVGLETNYEFMALGPGGVGEAEEAAIIARAQSAGRGPENFLTEELHALGRLATGRDEDGSRPARPLSLRDSAEVGLQELRLRHFGRLIARDRHPLCPINGILLLIPIAATNSEQSASLAGQICRRDLEAVRESMQVHCPVFALVCDLEGVPGFRDLIERLPVEQKRRRMGQRFPFVPDVDRAMIPNLLEGAVRWIAYRLLPAQVTSLWQVETTQDADPGSKLTGNLRLYRFLQQVRERHSRLARILSHAVLADDGPPAMLGGCYLAATGANPKTEQAFIPGVFRRLVESQDLVSWTPELLDAEDRYRRWATLGYSILIALVVLGALLVGYRVISTRSTTRPTTTAPPAASAAAGHPAPVGGRVEPGIRPRPIDPTPTKHGLPRGSTLRLALTGGPGEVLADRGGLDHG